jgi:hypothetical protein
MHVSSPGKENILMFEEKRKLRERKKNKGKELGVFEGVYFLRRRG